MALSDGHGTPLVVLTETASMHEVKLIEPLIKRVRIPRRGRGRPKKRVKRLIDGKAADSDPLRKRLKTRRIELIAPHRRVEGSHRCRMVGNFDVIVGGGKSRER